jgi:hypothetical protein
VTSHCLPVVPDLLNCEVAKGIEALGHCARLVSYLKTPDSAQALFGVFRAFGKGSQQRVLRAFAFSQER